ncbi:hypothetical protein GCM10009726_33760 [Nocardioides furvisabuli]|uniref:Uncharacterized protein n=1 Tax=Nocardioides furvisabuli TaxID=375542 RepID=A0ABN2XPX3_9ACTN
MSSARMLAPGTLTRPPSAGSTAAVLGTVTGAGDSSAGVSELLAAGSEAAGSSPDEPHPAMRVRAASAVAAATER